MRNTRESSKQEEEEEEEEEEDEEQHIRRSCCRQSCTVNSFWHSLSPSHSHTLVAPHSLALATGCLHRARPKRPPCHIVHKIKPKL